MSVRGKRRRPDAKENEKNDRRDVSTIGMFIAETKTKKAKKKPRKYDGWGALQQRNRFVRLWNECGETNVERNRSKRRGGVSLSVVATVNHTFRYAQHPPTIGCVREN